MADEKMISEQAVEARLGVALDALGHEVGSTALADNSLRAARQVLLALKLALISREVGPTSPSSGPNGSRKSPLD